MVPLEIQKDAFQPPKGPIINPPPMSNLQERTRLAREPGLDRGLYRCNFSFVNWFRSLALSHNQDDPGGYTNWEPVKRVEAAKNIPRKKWRFHFLEPVRPSAS